MPGRTPLLWPPCLLLRLLRGPAGLLLPLQSLLFRKAVRRLANPFPSLRCSHRRPRKYLRPLGKGSSHPVSIGVDRNFQLTCGRWHKSAKVRGSTLRWQVCLNQIWRAQTEMRIFLHFPHRNDKPLQRGRNFYYPTNVIMAEPSFFFPTSTVKNTLKVK